MLRSLHPGTAPESRCNPNRPISSRRGVLVALTLAALLVVPTGPTAALAASAPDSSAAVSVDEAARPPVLHWLLRSLEALLGCSSAAEEGPGMDPLGVDSPPASPDSSPDDSGLQDEGELDPGLDPNG